MVEINSNDHASYRKRKHRIKRTIPGGDKLKIDMTPMVDLGFLLIAFFIFANEISKPAVTKLYMPHEGDSTSIAASKSLTILLAGEDRVFYYTGSEEEAFKNNRVLQTNYDEASGLGKIIRQKQNELNQRGIGEKELSVLIKPGKETYYKYIISVLDEMLINKVAKYSIVDPGPWDFTYLEPR